MGREPKLCSHVKVNGDLCRAFRVNDSDYCYFHERTRRNERKRLKLGGPTSQNGNTGIKIYPIEDANSLLLANNEVLYAIMDQRIDPKRASLMLYSLQISASIMRQVHMTGDDINRYASYVPDEEDGEVSDAKEQVNSAAAPA